MMGSMSAILLNPNLSLNLTLRPIRRITIKRKIRIRKRDGPRLLRSPFRVAIGKPFPMRREKTAAMFPEQWLNDVAVCLRNVQRGNLFARKKAKSSLAMFRRTFFQPHFHFEKKDEPVA